MEPLIGGLGPAWRRALDHLTISGVVDRDDGLPARLALGLARSEVTRAPLRLLLVGPRGSGRTFIAHAIHRAFMHARDWPPIGPTTVPMAMVTGVGWDGASITDLAPLVGFSTVLDHLEATAAPGPGTHGNMRQRALEVANEVAAYVARRDGEMLTIGILHLPRLGTPPDRVVDADALVAAGLGEAAARCWDAMYWVAPLTDEPRRTMLRALAVEAAQKLGLLLNTTVRWSPGALALLLGDPRDLTLVTRRMHAALEAAAITGLDMAEDGVLPAIVVSPEHVPPRAVLPSIPYDTLESDRYGG